MTELSMSPRAAHLPSIIATPDPRWNAVAATYLLRDGLALADRNFGDYAKADVRFDHAKADIEAKHGRDFRASTEGSKSFDIIWADMKAAEGAQYENFLAPLWEAARQLALTPAPTISAIMFKIDVIRQEELDNDIYMTRDPMELVSEDMARLAVQTDPLAEWNALVAAFETVEAMPNDSITDASIDKAGELIGQIMAMPAPNAVAARWKLDWVLATDNGSTAAYEASYVAQTIADYRRYLGGEV